jgi:hypothetical protein
MTIEDLRPRVWLLALLASAFSAAALPSDARAKFTCEERGQEPNGIELRGLPSSPIAGRSYTLTVTLADAQGPNPSPYLGGQYCGEAIDPERAPGIDGRFRRAGGDASGVFKLNLRFSRPGPWALSFMGLDGSFYDFGLREVRPSGPAVRAALASGASPAGGSAARTWIAVGGALALTAGLGVALRRKGHT